MWCTDEEDEDARSRSSRGAEPDGPPQDRLVGVITIYSMCFNEEAILGFMIAHYRQRFPDCAIVIYDNESTDGTRDVALAHGCTVESYSTDGKVDDARLRSLKNNCWKGAKTDWVLVCDADELLDIDEAALRREDARGTTLIKSRGFNMVNLKDDYDLDAITHGFEAPLYGKDYLFKRTAIREINYVAGAHEASPVGDVKPSATRYTAYHFRHINPELSLKKQQYTKARLSEVNLRNGWSYHYMTDKTLADVRREYDAERRISWRVRRRSGEMEHFWQSINGFFTFPEFYEWVAKDLTAATATRFGRAVEVGVYTGQSAAFLGVELINAKAQVALDLVDTFDVGISLETVRKSLEPVAPIIGIIHKGRSVETAAFYENGSLDCVFIDAAHDYANVAADIDAWLPKVRAGGIIGGHDYCLEFSGVIKAVTERFDKIEVWRGRNGMGDARMKPNFYPCWCVRV